MTNGNKTLNINCRYLSETDFTALHRTLLEAFSDYFVPFKLTEEQLKNHIRQNFVRLERSVGAFSEDKMVGFTLNGFGTWNGRQTVYDAGTGIIPGFRHKGLGTMIFDFMTPFLQENGDEQILLEVISQNTNAIRLYRKLGFETTRRLVFFEQKESLDLRSNGDFEIREIPGPDRHLFESFSDGETSWQNSLRAVERTITKKVVLGAFLDEKCVGYGVVYLKSGTVPQLVVDPEHRRKGAASTILREMQKRLGESKKLRASNVDENIASALEFLRRRGFAETLSQLEMIKTL
jgi:ribosomal protein S18 acetylase RimI-like enzyme